MSVSEAVSVLSMLEELLALRLSSALTVSRWESLSVLWRVILVIALLFLTSYSLSGFLNKSDVSV